MEGQTKEMGALYGPTRNFPRPAQLGGGGKKVALTIPWVKKEDENQEEKKWFPSMKSDRRAIDTRNRESSGRGGRKQTNL